MVELEKVLRSALNDEGYIQWTEPLTPELWRPKVFWLFSELEGLANGLKSLDTTLDTLQHGQEAVWSADDPFPFLALNFLQTPVLFVKAILNGQMWNKVDFRLEKDFLSYVSQD